MAEDKKALACGTKLQKKGEDGDHYSTVIGSMYVKTTGGNVVCIYICQYAWDDMDEVVYDDGQVMGFGLHFFQVGFEDENGYEVLKEVE